jgi:hypothetical protein
MDDRRNDDGRFQWIFVIADRSTTSETLADATISTPEPMMTRGDHMTLDSDNPPTGETVGTYPEHDEAETNRTTLTINGEH